MTIQFLFIFPTSARRINSSISYTFGSSPHLYRMLCKFYINSLFDIISILLAKRPFHRYSRSENLVTFRKSSKWNFCGQYSEKIVVRKIHCMPNLQRKQAIRFTLINNWFFHKCFPSRTINLHAKMQYLISSWNLSGYCSHAAVSSTSSLVRN